MSSVVYGVQVFAKTYSPNHNCDWWNPVAIDDITVSYSSTCDCATMSPTITLAPTGVPSSSSPTPNITVSNEDDDSLLSSDLLIIVAAGAVVFVVVMMCFCWCDKWRSARKERQEAQRAARAREQEFSTY
jgi:hypothetical protein